MLTCRDVSRALASDELHTAAFVRRWRLRAHLLMCERCQAFAEELKTLTATMKRVSTSTPTLDGESAQANRVISRVRDSLGAGES